jgi:nicotinamide-nucleotide amidase
MQPLAAEIIAIGDEVLNGEIVNSNAAQVAARLEDAGWRVTRHTVVGDDADAILAAFAEAESRARVVIVSGGLGPTRDDIRQSRRDFGAAAAGRGMLGDRAFFERVGYP